MARAAKDGFELTTTMERILHQVTKEPGLWVNEIARTLNLAFPTVRDSLNELKKLGYVKALEGDREHYYFAKTTELEEGLCVLLNLEEAWQFLQHVALRPGVDTQEEVAAKLRVGEKRGLDTRTVRSYAERFEELGIIAKVPLPSSPSGGRPPIGYEIRWRNIEVPLGLFLAHLPSTSRASIRFAALLGMAPPKS